MKQLMDLATPFVSIAGQSDLPGQELAWLSDLRQQAVTQFEKAGLPNKKEEDWKYTSLWGLSQLDFNHDVAQANLEQAQIDEVALLAEAYRFVIVDGVFCSALSALAGLPTGVTVQPFSKSLSSAEGQLGQQVALDKAGLTALNTMMMKEGVMLHVAANTTVDKPIELLVISSGQTENLAVHLRNMLVLETGAEAAIVEHYAGLTDGVNFTNVVTEVALAEQAKLHHSKLQQESTQAFHIATLAAKQAASSEWHTHNIALGAALARTDVHTSLEGEQAHTTMDGLYLLKNEQHADTHTRIDHTVPNTTSNELYKGVLDDDCHAVFNGKVIVHKDAQKTDSNQYNHNLLLSRGCEIDTKPEMEIYADDVKCGHGSTVGQLDMDQLFFLRARGLDEVTARSLLTHAFAVEVLDRISSDVVREAFSALIEQRLPSGV